MNGDKLKLAIKNLSMEDKFIVFLPFLFVILGGLFGLILAFVMAFINYGIVQKYKKEKKLKYIFSLISFLLASFLFGILLSISSTFVQELMKGQSLPQ